MPAKKHVKQTKPKPDVRVLKISSTGPAKAFVKTKGTYIAAGGGYQGVATGVSVNGSEAFVFAPNQKTLLAAVRKMGYDPNTLDASKFQEVTIFATTNVSKMENRQ